MVGIIGKLAISMNYELFSKFLDKAADIELGGVDVFWIADAFDVFCEGEF